MAVEGIGNLVQNLSDHLLGQGQAPAAQAGGRILGTKDVGSPAAAEDTFTPSNGNEATRASAQDAGIFQVNPGSQAAATAGLLSAQQAPNANPAAVPGQAGSGPGSAPNTGANGAQAVTAAPGSSPGGNSEQGQGVASPATSAAVQNEIQQLNASLPALGLTNSQIEEIDRIASLVKDFNPAAYTNLVNQFEAQAQQSPQQNAAGAAQPSAPGSGSSVSAVVGSNANSGGSPAQQILIRLADSQGVPSSQPPSGGQNSTANPNLSGANGSQTEQPQFTLPNTNGQTTPVQSPHQSTGAGGGS
jgi:hypothetical protein